MHLCNKGIPIFIFVSYPREGSFSGFGEEKKKKIILLCFVSGQSPFIFIQNKWNVDEYWVFHEDELLYINLVIVTIKIIHLNRALSNSYVFFLNISVFFSWVLFFSL